MAQTLCHSNQRDLDHMGHVLRFGMHRVQVARIHWPIQALLPYTFIIVGDWPWRNTHHLLSSDSSPTGLIQGVGWLSWMKYFILPMVGNTTFKVSHPLTLAGVKLYKNACWLANSCSRARILDDIIKFSSQHALWRRSFLAIASSFFAILSN